MDGIFDEIVSTQVFSNIVLYSKIFHIFRLKIVNLNLRADKKKTEINIEFIFTVNVTKSLYRIISAQFGW